MSLLTHACGLERLMTRKLTDSQLLLNDNYLYGMWQSPLRHLLTWHHGGSDDGAPSGRPRQLPSWSWASATEGRIMWREINFLDSYDVKQVLPPEAPTEPGSVGHHCIILSGVVTCIVMQVGGFNPFYDEQERTFPLSRHCLLDLRTRRYSYNDSVPVMQGALGKWLSRVDESRRSSVARVDEYMEREEAEERTGQLNADFRWLDWDKFRNLQVLTVLVVGYVASPSCTTSADSRGLRAQAMVLKLQPGDRPLPRYERIGWLQFWVEATMLQAWPVSTIELC